MLEMCDAHRDILRREIALAGLVPVEYRNFDPFALGEHEILEGALNNIFEWDGLPGVLGVVLMDGCAVCRVQTLHDERGCDGPPCPGTFDVWFPAVCEGLRRVLQAMTS